jgi:hypothetical protein
MLIKPNPMNFFFMATIVTVIVKFWKWRFLCDADAMWAALLRFRYGHLPTQVLGGGAASSSGTKASLWWKDVIGMGSGIPEDWFKSNVSCCVGDGKNIGFWKFKWYGNHCFKDLYPNLFAKDASQDVIIADRLHGVGITATWAWQWSNQLSDSEEQQVNSLIELLVGFSLQPDSPDRWRWTPGIAGTFSVSSCYTLLLELRQNEALDPGVLLAVKNLWKNDVPSKVAVFGWRLLLDRLPTRGALSHRGILNNPQDISCIFCSHHVEERAHLFFNCPFSKGVWEAMFCWLGRRISTYGECWNHFLSFGNLFKSKKGDG